jgi:hypothetical protein
MKSLKLLPLFLVLTLLFSSCNKTGVEPSTGTLKIQFASASNDFKAVSIYGYSLEDKSVILFIDQPNSKGEYIRKLLQGNYYVEVYYPGGNAKGGFQLIGGETYELKYSF